MSAILGLPLSRLINCRACRGARQKLRSAILTAYKIIFARPSMQWANDALLQVALRGRGFSNCCEINKTGELLFLNLLTRHKPKLCLDIGANNGSYSAALLELTDAHVIAFEPQPSAFAGVAALAARFPNRITAINKGVGGKAEMLRLYFGETNSETASFVAEAREIGYVASFNNQSMMVDVVSLDDFFEGVDGNGLGAIDFLKIDTEGFEYEVLAGARNTIATRRPKFVQIEYNWHHLFRGHTLFKLAALLPGYDSYQLLPYGSGLRRIDVRAPESNIFLYSNFVFARSDIAL